MSVSGRIMETSSMQLLARLKTLPVVAKRAALGGKSGMPLVKVKVSESRIVTTTERGAQVCRART